MERMLLGFVALVIVCVAPNVADATARTLFACTPEERGWGYYLQSLFVPANEAGWSEA